MNYLFNRNPLIYGRSIEQPSVEVLKNTPQLWNASLDDALKYGGDLTKTAIGAMDLKFDRKYIVVDTKIHMLMPGFYPAIPNWHTDGVPRGQELRPEVKDWPNIHAQESMTTSRYHLLVTGEGCLTQFMKEPLILDCKMGSETYNLYEDVNHQISQIDYNNLDIVAIPSCQVLTWDWWNLHRGIQAIKHEWRYLIRVTETDHMQPQTDLRQILRTQIQVYVPESFGW
jgi:hypothetical protein